MTYATRDAILRITDRAARTLARFAAIFYVLLGVLKP